MILLVNGITLYRLPLFFLAYRGIVSHVLFLYGLVLCIVVSTWIVRKIIHLTSNATLHTIGLALALLGLTASFFAIHAPLLAASLLCVGVSVGCSIRITT